MTEPRKFVTDVDVGTVEHPRKLVVVFAYPTCDMINTDKGDHPQLLHHQYPISRPSRLVRFMTRLGLSNGNKAEIEDAVASIYRFLSHNYAPGDQVTLAIGLYVDMDMDPNLVVARMLARHLHDGTHPDSLSQVQSGNADDVPARRIPIHCVAVKVDRTESISVCNDELRSRFPPGIGHIVCCAFVVEGCSSCSTTYESDGSLISREICLSLDADGYDLWFHSTKQFIYYGKSWIPKWDEHEPVWTQVLNSSPRQTQDLVTLALVEPVGMHRHELRKYQGLPGRDSWGRSMVISMLVWKSYRSGGGRDH